MGCHGGRASKSSQRRRKLKELPSLTRSTTLSTSQSDQPRSHSECLSLVSTRSRVLVMLSLDVSNKVHSSQTSTSSSHLPESPESASPSKCTTSQLQRLDQETTLVSTSRDSQKRTCPKLEMLCQSKTKMVTPTHQRLLTLSELLFLFRIILDN